MKVASFWTLAVVLVLGRAVFAEDRVEVAVGYTSPPKAKKDKIDDYLAELKKAGLPSQPPLLNFSSFEVGDIGKLPYEVDPLHPQPFVDTKILQVIDDDEMLVTVERWGWKMAFVGKVAGGATPVERDSTVVLFRGVSTAGQVDGKKFLIGGGFHVSGTYKYKTAVGQKTVYVLEPINLPKIADERALERERIEKELAAQQAKEAKKAKVKEDEAAGIGRLWRDKDGKELGRGDLLSFKRGFVELQFGDKKKTLSLTQLSKEDRDWVRINAGKK